MITSNLRRWQRPLLQACHRYQTPCINNTQALNKHHHQQQRRTLLTRPQINHEATFRERGVPGLLSKEGFDISWTQYQSYIIEQINERVAGTPDHALPPRSLLIKHARSAANAPIFNYASMADNNHLFFSTLSPVTTRPSAHLSTRIKDDFSSMDALRETFLATAGAMFGPGFTWLVKMAHGDTLHILNTYIAGSPWPAAHYRRQSVDMNNHPNLPNGHPDKRDSNPSSYTQISPYKQGASRGADATTAAGDWNTATKSFSLEVLMGVNTWEHVWLRDYGVHGKENFLARWWDRIDWDAVERNAHFKRRDSYR